MLEGFATLDFFRDLAAVAIVLVVLLFLPLPALVLRLVFTLAGGYLLFFIAPRLLAFYLLFWLVVWGVQNVVATCSETRWRNVVLWAALGIVLGPMVYWKLNYADFNVAFNVIGNELLGSISPWLQQIDFASNVIIPIGLSFATFRACDLLVKSWIGSLPGLSIDRCLFYGFFPPVQVIGPIIEYGEVAGQAERFAAPSADDIVAGCLRLAVGFLKVLFVALVLAPSATIFQTFPGEPVWINWGYLFIYTWFFYLNFSAFSDLAIGFARLFGFRLRENFSFPFFRRNIAEFWNNWHMSLSHFAQRNVYVPMGGYRRGTAYPATLATIMVIALWHDLTLGMVIFGLYHGAGLVAQRAWSDRRSARSGQAGIAANWLSIGATYVFVALSFPLLVMPLERAAAFYLALLGIS